MSFNRYISTSLYLYCTSFMRFVMCEINWFLIFLNNPESFIHAHLLQTNVCRYKYCQSYCTDT